MQRFPIHFIAPRQRPTPLQCQRSAHRYSTTGDVRTVHFGHQCYHFPFIPADVISPIMSFDFLVHFKLLVDPLRRCVLNFFSAAHQRPSTAWAAPHHSSPPSRLPHLISAPFSPSFPLFMHLPPMLPLLLTVWNITSSQLVIVGHS